MSALASIAGTIVFLLILDIFRRRQARFRTRNLDPGSVSYAFFHPDALSGGGGERVLWQAVAAMQAKWPAGRIIIYIRSHTLSGEAVAAKIKVRGARFCRFQADRPYRVNSTSILTFLGLILSTSAMPSGLRRSGAFQSASLYGNRTLTWCRLARYPRLTLIAQSLGAVIPGIEALLKYRPDVFVGEIAFHPTTASTLALPAP